MDTQFDEAIEDRPALMKELLGVTSMFENVIGLSAPSARVSWNLTQDNWGRDLVELRVSDWTGSVSYRFAMDELGDEKHMWFRLHRLWGDLLTVRLHVQMDGNLGPYQEQAG